MTASLFAKNRGLDVAVVEGGRAGGQLRTVYPYKPVYNYPGNYGVPAGELAKRMVAEVASAGIEISEGSPVEAVETLNGLFRLHIPGCVMSGNAVVIATGLGLFEPRPLGVPGEQDAAGNSLFYTVTDPAEWSDLRVAVIGGGDAAVDNALLLSRGGAHVTLVHRRRELTAQVESVRELASEGVEMRLGRAVDSFASNDGGLEIRVEAEPGQDQRIGSFDRVLVNAGMVARNAFLDSLGVPRAKVGVCVDTEMRAPVPGMFACGDVAEYPGKVRLIVTAMGEAATAIGAAERYLKARGHGG